MVHYLRSLGALLTRIIRIRWLRSKCTFVCIFVALCLYVIGLALMNRYHHNDHTVSLQRQNRQQKRHVMVGELMGLWQRRVPLSPLLEQLIGNSLTSLSYVHAGMTSASTQVPFQCTPDYNQIRKHLIPSEDMAEPLKFQMAFPDNEDIFVYSAYFDRRWYPTPVVVIIGISNIIRLNAPKYCRIWYRGDVIEQAHVTPLYYRHSFETHGHPYTAVFYTCFVRDNDVIPYAVSVVNDACAWHCLLKVNALPTTSHVTNSPGPLNFTVCLSPFYNNFDDDRQLVEWIEVNRMYGAQHFIIYDYKTGQNVSRYIEHFYRKLLGVTTVIPWSLPIAADYDMPTPVQIHSYGQVAALNDCLHRCLSINQSAFVVFSDTDEIIVPRRHDSWSAMLHDVTSKWFLKPGKSLTLPGFFKFRSTIFRIDWPIDTTFVGRSSEYQNLKTLYTTDREERIFDELTRTKYIVWTKAMVQLNIHVPAAIIHPADGESVDVTDCLIHHYRDWGIDPGPPPVHVQDRRMHRYADVIAHNTDLVHQWMFGE